MTDRAFTKVHPALGRVAVELFPEPEKIGLLYRPQSAESLTSRHVGTVVALCDSYTTEDGEQGPLYKLGDIVAFGKYAGTQVTINKQEIIIMNERDILCTLEEEDAGRDGATAPEGVIPITRGS